MLPSLGHVWRIQWQFIRSTAVCSSWKQILWELSSDSTFQTLCTFNRHSFKRHFTVLIMLICHIAWNDILKKPSLYRQMTADCVWCKIVCRARARVAQKSTEVAAYCKIQVTGETGYCDGLLLLDSGYNMELNISKRKAYQVSLKSSVKAHAKLGIRATQESPQVTLQSIHQPVSRWNYVELVSSFGCVCMERWICSWKWAFIDKTVTHSSRGSL